MTTAAQIFKAACDQARWGKELADVPVEKILNRLDDEVILEMQRALAQQFVLLMRHAAEGIDVNRPGLTIRERIERAERMRTIEASPAKPLSLPSK
jgi:hypothetical protein